MAHHGRTGKSAVPTGNSSKARGRTAKTTSPDRTAGPKAKSGNVKQDRVAGANRPTKAGGGKKRGDRRDTHPDPGRRDNERSGLRNDRNPSSTTGRRKNKIPNEGG